MKVRRSKHGVTLIEIVAALGIISVGIVGILALFPVAIDAGARAGNRSAAAVLGEYVIEQVRLRAYLIDDNDDTQEMLDKLNWDDYDYDGKSFTFDANADGDDQPSTLPATRDAYGTGEQIMWQRENPDNPYDPDDPEKANNGLGDQELYSRYEVTIELVDVVVNGNKTPFDNDELKQVIVTVRWPRAFNEDDRKKQSTMRFVTFIRPVQL